MPPRQVAGAVLGAFLLLLTQPLRAQEPQPLTIFAAASLREWLDGLATSWTAGGRPAPRLVYGASGTLARQIEHGAPADVFLSADQAWMDYLVEKVRIPRENRRIIAGNRLVVVASLDSRRVIDFAAQPDDLAFHVSDRIAVGDPRSVPAGAYAKEALEKLALWDKLSPRLVMVENVRFALAMVARGDVKTGLVYASDAAAEPKVRVIGTFPETLHKPISYHAGRLPASAHPQADAFFAYLSSPESRAALARLGFLPPPD
ncbi:MAG: molybdate ABC transporter substrate-binding protein [Proteobacteria bacterium]|nr:molybdate ABC transporter substrate-binding protein [Pseudomonadota bacterium]